MVLKVASISPPTSPSMLQLWTSRLYSSAELMPSVQSSQSGKTAERLLQHCSAHVVQFGLHGRQCLCRQSGSQRLLCFHVEADYRIVPWRLQYGAMETRPLLFATLRPGRLFAVRDLLPRRCTRSSTSSAVRIRLVCDSLSFVVSAGYSREQRYAAQDGQYLLEVRQP